MTSREERLKVETYFVMMYGGFVVQALGLLVTPVTTSFFLLLKSGSSTGQIFGVNLTQADHPLSSIDSST